MDDRRHVYHDPMHPPHEIVSGGVPGITQQRAPRRPSSRRARTTAWVFLWATLGLIFVTGAAFLTAIAVGGIMDASDDALFYAPVTEAEEAGVRGIAATIVDRGRRRDYDGVLALGDGSKAFDRSELASDLAATFDDKRVTGAEIDPESTRLLKEKRTGARIVSFELLVDTQDDYYRSSPTFYVRELKGKWVLTGIRGLQVTEVLY